MSVAPRTGGYEPGDIDLVMVHAIHRDKHVVGDAAYLLDRLGIRAPAFNFESACTSATLGFHLAADLIRVGRYRTSWSIRRRPGTQNFARGRSVSTSIEQLTTTRDSPIVVQFSG